MNQNSLTLQPTFSTLKQRQMNKSFLFGIASLLILGSHASAQQRNDSSTRSKMIEGIKKEKMRKPVKLEANSEEIKKNESTQKTRATDLKVSIINSGNEEGEAQICMNPSNPNQLVMSFMDNTSSGIINYPVYYSNNGGSSWTKSSFNAYNQLSAEFPGYSFAGGGDPVFAWDKNNNLYFSWIYLLINNTFDTAVAAMHWARSVNGGNSFTLQSGNNRFIGKANLDPFSFEAMPGSEGFYDRQWLAVDNSGGAFANQLYVSFIYFNTPTESGALTGSTIKKLNAGGTAFGNKIQAMSGAIQFNNIRVDNAGVLHLTGANVDNNAVVYCKSTDGGNTFSNPITVYTGTNLFGSQGSGYVHDRENAAVNMEVDGAKNVHVVWSDFEASAGPNFKAYYSRLNTGSSSFITPIDLNTLFVSGQKVLMPVVSTAGNRVTIGAYVINSALVGDYYIINSQDNGITWSAPIKVSSGSTTYNSASNTGAWFGDYYNAVRSDNMVYNIWSDGRSTGGPKMYVSTTTLWGTATTDLTPINSNLQLENVYPNPAADELNLQFHCVHADAITLEVYSVDGKRLLAQAHKLTAGDSQILLPVSTWAAGHYIIKIRNSEGFDLSRHIEVTH